MMDSHAHLDDKAFQQDLPEVVERARASHIQAVVNPGVDVDSSRAALELSRSYPGFIFPAVGIHPHSCQNATEEDWQVLESLLQSDSIVAIGETGLDFYKNYSPREAQISAFERHIHLAKRYRLPLIIHIRGAFQEVYQMLCRYAPLLGVLHSFSSNFRDAQRFIELGLYLSFSGVLTYPKADEIRQAAASTPPHRILVETDAPYLPPQNHRGKRCEPAYMQETLLALAHLKNLSVKEVDTLTAENTYHLFSRLPLPISGIEDKWISFSSATGKNKQ